MASWPRYRDYADALLEPETLGDQELRGLELVRDKHDYPRMMRGQFGTVFHFGTSQESYAFKVFSFNRPDLRDRQLKISEHLRSLSGRYACLVDISYLEKGVFVNGDWYPAVKMKWCEGQTLSAYLGSHLQNGGRIDNAALGRAWLDVLSQLRSAQVLHGDLQEGNILVDARGKLCLVDYDGMFVPSMLGAYEPLEGGHPSYQHPLRTSGECRAVDRPVEDFSGLVVLADLLAATPERCKRFARQDGILISQRDLANPDGSDVLADLSEAAEPLGAVASLLREALSALPDASRALAEAAGILGVSLSVPTEPSVPVSPPPGGQVVVPEEDEPGRLIAQHIGQGLSNAAIAEQLGLPVARVRSRILRLQQELQVSSRSDIPAALLGPSPEPALSSEVRPQGGPPERLSTPPQLTDDEKGLLLQLAAGRSPVEAARALGVPPATLRRHSSSLLCARTLKSS